MALKLSAAIVTTLLTMNCAKVHAELIAVDLFTSGDELVTRDTSTGLEWLDIPLSIGLSYDQAEASNFATHLGFRHASVVEVFALFIELGMSDFSNSFQPVNYQGALAFIELFGPGRDSGNFDSLEAFADLDPFDTHLVAIVAVDATHPGGNGNARVGSSLPYQTKSSNNGFTGNFLIRRFAANSEVPEPASIVLWSLVGLACLGVRRALGRIAAAF